MKIKNKNISIKEQIELAESKFTQKQILYRLATEACFWVRSKAIKNSKTPTNAIMKVYRKDKSIKLQIIARSLILQRGKSINQKRCNYES